MGTYIQYTDVADWLGDAELLDQDEVNTLISKVERVFEVYRCEPKDTDGNVVAVDPVPDQLVIGLLMWVEAEYNGGAGIASEQIGAYSYRKAQSAVRSGNVNAMPTEAKNMLAPWLCAAAFVGPAKTMTTYPARYADLHDVEDWWEGI